jgi:hypothetical protein
MGSLRSSFILWSGLLMAINMPCRIAFPLSVWISISMKILPRISAGDGDLIDPYLLATRSKALASGDRSLQIPILRVFLT